MPPQRRKGSIGGGGGLGRNPLSDEAEHTPPVSPLRDAKWPRTPQLSKAATAVLLSPAKPAAAESKSDIPAEPRIISTAPKTTAPAAPIRAAVAVVPVEPAPAAADPAPSVLELPLPATGGEGPLSRSESEQLEVCESSIDALRVAFWTAGRALQIVRDGRLYRADHATFDEYVEKRWDMQRSYAHKLIRAWPLAARLHPVAPSINEGQIRELLPVVAAHGEEAAVTVYTTLAADVKVTAGKLREAVAVLPSAYDEGEVVQRLQAWLRGDLLEEQPDAPDVFSSVETRLAALTQKVVKGSTDHPAEAREFAAKLRTLAELIERQIPASG
ncbi:hypothetical protein [Nocardia seriolae]|uniref:Uncharacterized protein n=1 Tax=Nocardia seriolae TaxID=37332 RepID=A0ABC8ANN8_9NOCA|nr:hypothetical protein [Nocardia seriolae]APA95614.1 hypothetical protein NS506_01543 [Nocardia seriolae]MTJ66253.1 hypothetical protein [Nocardia seriolae]MTJ76061.1 hypothetical protein [Nocardia seriolae]MTJ85834.1 hypothetical protein [Nocardia seriolae]MTK44245.1 hypothetical protein [Nocardia seriolae]